MGPGWHLFGQPHHEAKRPDRSREEIEEELRAVLDRIEDAETKHERRDAVHELKAAVAEIAVSPPPELAARIREIETIIGLRVKADALLRQVREVLEREQSQEQDDMEAFLILAELA